MPGARIPGFLDIGQRHIVNHPRPINGVPPPTTTTTSVGKTINEIAVEGLILFPPPPLVQSELYNFPEGPMACWVTVAEMILRHRNASAKVRRPTFGSFLPVDTAEKKLLYRGFVEGFIRNLGFDTVPGGKSSAFKWDVTLVASTLSKLGPLLCIGDFGPPGQPSLAGTEPEVKPGSGKPVDIDKLVIHTVAVFGAQNSSVYLRDPANGNVVIMHIDEFNTRADIGTAWGQNDMWFLKGNQRVLPGTTGA